MDRQTDRQTDEQTDKKTDRQTDRQTETYIYRHELRINTDTQGSFADTQGSFVDTQRDSEVERTDTYLSRSLLQKGPVCGALLEQGSDL